MEQHVLDYLRTARKMSTEALEVRLARTPIFIDTVLWCIYEKVESYNSVNSFSDKVIDLVLLHTDDYLIDHPKLWIETTSVTLLISNLFRQLARNSLMQSMLKITRRQKLIVLYVVFRHLDGILKGRIVKKGT